jgi:hypothetical protein
MNNDKCERCGGDLIEIDHYGKPLTGCPTYNRWQALTGEWCHSRFDIMALRAAAKAERTWLVPL